MTLQSKTRPRSIFHLVLPHEGLVLVRAQQDLSRLQLARWLSALERDPEYKRTMQGLFDLRRGKLLMSYDDTVALAEEVMRNQIKQNTWVVLTNTPINTALSLVYGNHLENRFPFVVCSTESEAERMLGRPIRPLIHLLDGRAGVLGETPI